METPLRNLKICLLCLFFLLLSLPIVNAQPTDGLDRLIESQTQAIKADPNSYIAYVSRGGAYMEKKQFDLAIADFSKALQLKPNEDLLYFLRAHAYSELKKYDLSIADCNKALTIKPSSALYYVKRCHTYYQKKEYALALDDANKAIELEPLLSLGYNARGNVLALQGHYEEALKDFQKALDLAKFPFERDSVYFNLAQTNELSGNQAEAIKYYQLVKNYDIDESVNRKIQARLAGDWNQFPEWI
jgi:Tetratricopeptide repeat.